jgi:hypothetical protein
VCSSALITANLPQIRKNIAAFEAEQKLRRRIPTDKDFAKLVTAHRGRIATLTDALAQGTYTEREYIENLFALLEDGHTESVRLARGLNEDFTPLEDDDRGFASLVMDGEAEFLARFLNDLVSGRYRDAGGELKTKAVAARARMYTGKYRGTANEVFVLSSPDGEKFAWHQLTIEPCDDCPRIERGGPYTSEQLALIGHPGQGRQQCRTQCGCLLRRISDNRFGFSRSYE